MRWTLFLRVAGVLLACGVSLRGQDCDANGVDDAVEIESGAKADCDSNGIPDQCDVAVPAIGFGSPEEIPLPRVAQAAEAGDFDGDGDGDLDLVVATGDGTIDVLKNAGGAFSVAQFLPGFFPRGFRVGDVSGDGDLDIVAIPADVLVVLDNDGTGSFEPRAPVETSTDEGGVVAFGDLDGDGDLELTSVERGRFPFDVVIHRNAGAEGFVREVVAFQLESPPFCLLVVDVDGDGALDIFAFGFPSLAFLNDGGQFLGRVQGFGKLAVEFAADIDGDGDADLFARDDPVGRGALRLFENRGGGEFAPGQSLSGTTQLRQPTFDLLDLDSDGVTDLVAAPPQRGGGIPLAYLGDDAGGFSAAHPVVQIPSLTVNAVVYADLFDDGKIELVAVVTPRRGDRRPGLAVLRNEPLSLSDCDRNEFPDM